MCECASAFMYNKFLKLWEKWKKNGYDEDVHVTVRKFRSNISPVVSVRDGNIFECYHSLLDVSIKWSFKIHSCKFCDTHAHKSIAQKYFYHFYQSFLIFMIMIRRIQILYTFVLLAWNLIVARVTPWTF